MGIKFSFISGKCLFFFILLLSIISGCSENQEKDSSLSSDETQLTGAAITKILRACKYESGRFCEEACCISDDKCANGETAYQECDLESGEWKNRNYSDKGCIIECENAIPKASESTCEEGWVCKDYYHRTYQTSDCSTIDEEYCERGCENNSCITACKPGSLTCSGNIVRICSNDGNAWSKYKECISSCSNSECIGTNETNMSSPPAQNQTNESQNNDYIKDKCINVVKFNYTGGPKPTDEYFILKNECNYLIDMAGWTAKDDSNASGHIFTFPAFILGVNSEITIVTGIGTNSLTHLYWGRGSAIWNNDKDVLYLSDSKGKSVLIYSYP